ncbi:MAG: RluA family pseudouridine synthase [Kiritimatiellae bacterium]|nr:RluA family pseudouridine synthase [Kiritimatiellia bacterium]
MIENASFQVETSGVRLDAALLSSFPTSTRAFCREACAAGEVTVDGRPALKGMKLPRGAQVLVKRLAEASDNRVAPDRSIRVHCLFEDDAILAFDKPPSQPVQPLTCHETGTLMNGVVARWPDVREIGDQPLMAGALHRIDADTSGLVLVARTPAAFGNLRAQFAAQTVKKTYLALVEGSVAVGGTLENDLVHVPGLSYCKMTDISRARLTRTGRTGGTSPRHLPTPLHAVTNFRPIARTTVANEERTLLEVAIHTGVTHQIRAQLALAGMHIVNDRLYGAFAVADQVGHCLHALAARFRHPVSGDETEIRTTFPPWADIL